jgi:tetratricopeptide (TPR) repeat protein
MGFSIQQARVALAATDTGLDVEAALDTLLNNVSAENASASTADFDGGRGELSEEEAWERREEERERRRRRRRNGARATSSPSSSTGPPSRRQQTADRDRSSPVDGGPQGQQADASDAAAQLRDQADKYLSQASEIGLNMLKSANSFWFSSKAQLQKAYEERRAAGAAVTAPNAGSAAIGTLPSTSMRPRWAQSDVEEDMEDDLTPRATGGFRDDDGDDNEDGGRDAGRPDESVLQAPPPMPKRPSSSKKRQPEIDLFAQVAEERPGPYQSPHRRRPAATRERDTLSRSSRPTAPASSRATSSRTHAQPSPPTIRPPPLYKRTLVTASSSVLAQSKSYRSRGTEMFKLGQFGEAEAAYGNAIAVLPKGQLVLVPLLNNRAAARLKTGEYKGAVEDCSAVLDMIEPPTGHTTPTNEGMGRYHPSREESIPPLEDGEAVSLAEGYVKALQKRAQAYESAEKWAHARTDWERLVGVDWPAGLRMRQEAVRGIGRCRQMLGGSDPAGAGVTFSTPKPGASAPPPTKAKAKPRRSTQHLADLNTITNSSGVAKLRAQADTQEAEDSERIRIKDSVDARLIAWKGGKEANLRALIASLEIVLWPELGWAKVGMHELVTPAQVKVRYMKAIGRVHPDKVRSTEVFIIFAWRANLIFFF